MDWKLSGAAFLAVFLAEMGDKTQLAAMALSAESRKPLAVFLGASGALVVVTAIGVTAGAVVSRYVPQQWIERAAGIAFVLVGLWMLFGRRG